METDGLPAGVDAAAALGVIETRGNYAGRGVSYVRVFDRAGAAAREVDVQTFGDLDAHPDLVLRMGHVEKDGTVVITWRAPSPEARTPAREQADRTTHDDGNFVFPGQAR
ncbi:MAG: hypothetical protein H0V51_16965 [Chloroflexi bacterium]|nr:hypothetical protein [Chloroflexota bacterium]